MKNCQRNNDESRQPWIDLTGALISHFKRGGERPLPGKPSPTKTDRSRAGTHRGSFGFPIFEFHGTLPERVGDHACVPETLGG